MARGDYRASFELTMARKDVRLMIEAAAGRPLAVLPAIAGRMDALIERGFGADDVGVLSVDAVAKGGE
jgi:3-hydroxyisobutyrate dehydrogenase-like beta-hydroxyacid dehydrogenase